MAEIEITGLDKVQRMLRKNLTPAFRKAAFSIGQLVQKTIAKYPPKRAPANPGRWYQRGFGPRWRRKDGSVGGRVTSEQLGQRWSVESKGDGAVVGNPVSYAPWVQSEEKQAQIHKATGWITDVEVADEVASSDKAARIVTEAVVTEMKR